MNYNIILRYIIIICLLITIIIILYKINNYKKTIENNNDCLLIDKWNLEDEIRKFTNLQDSLLKK